jgi:hypothetical protein
LFEYVESLNVDSRDKNEAVDEGRYSVVDDVEGEGAREDWVVDRFRYDALRDKIAER